MLTKEVQKEIAQTTLNYLGGAGKVRAMVGVEFFEVGDNGELSFRFKGNRSINYVTFSVNGKDLYDVTFYRIRNFEKKEVSKHNDYYFDQIKSLFEQETKLYLSLF